jgi:hypothetical protein
MANAETERIPSTRTLLQQFRDRLSTGTIDNIPALAYAVVGDIEPGFAYVGGIQEGSVPYGLELDERIVITPAKTIGVVQIAHERFFDSRWTPISRLTMPLPQQWNVADAYVYGEVNGLYACHTELRIQPVTPHGIELDQLALGRKRL